MHIQQKVRELHDALPPPGTKTHEYALIRAIQELAKLYGIELQYPQFYSFDVSIFCVNGQRFGEEFAKLLSAHPWRTGMACYGYNKGIAILPENSWVFVPYLHLLEIIKHAAGLEYKS